MIRNWLSASFLLLFIATQTRAEEKPFRYPEGKHGGGQLRYVNDIPVLTVAGKPEEIGEQVGVLALKHAPQMVETVKSAVRDHVGDIGWLLARGAAKGVFQKFPEEYRKEIEAMARSGGVDRDVLAVANAIYDLKGIQGQGGRGCAGLVIEPSRSTTGGPLFGRNLDTPPSGRIAEIGLVVVYRPEGKRPFAMVTFPGLLACFCGMNADGLAFGCDDVTAAADGSQAFNADGVPSVVAQRRILEQCQTVQETEKWLQGNPVTIRGIMPVIDLQAAAVFEVTPKTIVRRPATDHIACCTNHFLSEKLKLDIHCNRLPELEKAWKLEKLSVADVAARMHAANAQECTVHTMVFEPKALKLHLAFGDGKKSATEFRLQEIDLRALLKP